MQTSPAGVATEASPATVETSTVIRRIDRWLAAGLGTLAVALTANSILGPLLTDVIAYPFSESMYNQTMGLEAVSLAVVVPWALLAAALVRRRYRAAPFLAIPPAAYTAYMFAQYVVGPTYLTYRPIVAFHLGIFVLAGLLVALSLRRMHLTPLPETTARRDRRATLGLLGLAAFVTFRYLPVFGGMLDNAPLSAEAAADPTMFWMIVFLDLGVVVPTTVAVAWGLLRGASWARHAVYGVAGWFVLVPISVAAMGAVMLLNDDPNAAVAQVVVLSVAAVLFTAFAAWVYRPLFGPAPSDDSREAPSQPSA